MGLCWVTFRAFLVFVGLLGVGLFGGLVGVVILEGSGDFPGWCFGFWLVSWSELRG